MKYIYFRVIVFVLFLLLTRQTLAQVEGCTNIYMNETDPFWTTDSYIYYNDSVNKGVMNVSYFSQCDTWGGNQLGFCTSKTICSHGCAMTSVAMIGATVGANIDPGEFNEWLIAQGGGVGYTAGGCDIYWGAIHQYLGCNSISYNSNIYYDISIIRDQVNYGNPVVVWVDTDYDNVLNHFVVVIGYDNEGVSPEDYLVNDPNPASGGNTHLSDYNLIADTRLFLYNVGIEYPFTDFVAESTNVEVGETISFTDLTSNNPTEWSWAFEGGNPATSTMQNPNVVYNALGDFKVTLVATNEKGYNVAIKDDYIHVTNIPIDADFTASNIFVIVGSTIDFTDLSTSEPLSWDWSFDGGNPSSSTMQNPSVLYNSIGNYTVGLIAANAYSEATEIKTNYITVFEASDVLNAAFVFTPEDVFVNESIQFTDMSTGNIEAWWWDFGDGSTSDIQSPIKTYLYEGTYTVALSIYGNYDFETTTQIISVNNIPPDVVISGKVTTNDFVQTPISDAAVTCDIISVLTDELGEYAMSVPYGWEGEITVSKVGYDTYADTYGPFFSSVIRDFELYNFSSFHLSCAANPNTVYINEDIISSCNIIGGEPPYTMRFEVFMDGDIVSTELFEDFNNFYNETFYHFTGIAEDCKVCWKVTDSQNQQVSCCEQIWVNENNIDIVFANFTNECSYSSVVNVNTPVVFNDLSFSSDDTRPIKRWEWCFDLETNTDDCPWWAGIQNSCNWDMEYSVRRDNVEHTYNTIGHKIIKLKVSDIDYVPSSILLGQNLRADYDVHFAGINVIDCSLTSSFSLLNSLFTDAIRDQWHYENNGGPVYIYGGTLQFNGEANNYLSETDMTLSVCNEIIISGDVEFIADGSTELILEINNSPCLQGNTQRLSKAKQNFVSPNIFSCYPNPFVDEINIYVNIQKEQKIDIAIIDLLGKQLFHSVDTYRKGGSLIKINMPKLEPGAYIVNIYNNEIYETYKIIKKY